MKAQVITTSNVNVLAVTSLVAATIGIVSGIFAYYYTAEVMSFTQEFSVFGLGW